MKSNAYAKLLITLGLGLAATLALLLALGSGAARAATLTVGSSGTYATIQAAVDAASPGDEIRVQNEIFVDSVVITKSLTLLGGYDATFDDSTRVPRSTVISPTDRGFAITGLGLDVAVDGFEIRNASAAGASGAGIFVQVQTNSRVTIHDNFIHDNATDIDSGGIYATALYNSELDITDNDVMSNTAGNNAAGIFAYVLYSSTLTLDRNQIVSNTAGGDIGGLYAVASTNGHIHAVDLHIKRNIASDIGGASFFATLNSRVQAPNLYVYANRARDGETGGVFLGTNWRSDAVLAPGARVISNSASTDAGGAYVLLDNGGTVDLTGGLFEGNTAAAGNGGGLYVTAVNMGATLSLSDTNFLTNTADAAGGGAYFGNGPLYGSHLGLSNAHFISNTASIGPGGGLYMGDQGYNYASTQADHTQFIRNKAGGPGGAVFLATAQYGAHVTFDDGLFRENVAAAPGGAFYSAGCVQGCRFSVSRSDFEHNRASGGGGAFYVSQAAVGGAQAYFDDNTFVGNSTDGPGGAFFAGILADMGSFASFSGNEVINNMASAGPGGGLFVSAVLAGTGSAVHLNGNTVRDNVAGAPGAGLYLGTTTINAQVDLSDNVIAGNVISSASSYEGGGVYLLEIGQGTEAAMTGNVITGNVATGDGGGLYIANGVNTGSALRFEDNDLLDNQAGGNCGGCGIEGSGISNGAALYFNDNRVNGNTVLSNSGGCHFSVVQAAVAYLGGNQFNGNTAGQSIGALGIEGVDAGSQVRLWDNAFIGNRAGISGTQVLGGQIGGVLLGPIQAQSGVDFHNNQVLSNTAYISGTSGGNIGGLYAVLNAGGWLAMQDNTVADNTAEQDGGGIGVDLSGGRLTMAHNLIRANTASKRYGGVFLVGANDAEYTLQRNQIISNSAETGDGLYVNDHDSTFQGHSENNLIAGNQGSGIYLESTNFRSLNDTVADNGQYGIWMTGTLTSTAYVSNTIIWGHVLSFDSAHPTTQTMEADYSDIEGGWPGVNNLNTDPLFLGGGDYHLQGTSPVLNQADATVAPARDLDDIPRPVGAGVDMGAYEFHLSGVTLSGDGLLVGDPGTWVTHTLTLTNDGEAEDAFALSMSGNAWPAHLPVNHVVLAAGADTSLDIAVYVPDDASAGEGDTVTVDAVSTRNALVVDSASVDTEATLVPDVDVYPDHTAEANVGQTQVYPHVVQNQSNGAETFDLIVSSSQGWAVQVLPDSVTLGQGLSTTIKVRVTVPSDAVGQVDVTMLTATARSDGSVSDSASDTTTAVNTANLTLGPNRTATALVGDSQTYTHTLTNQADVTDTVHLAASSDRGWAVSVSPPSITLAAGTSATVYVTVTAPGSGANGTTDLTRVTATSGNDPGVTDQADDVTTLLNPASILLATDQAQAVAQGETAVYTHTLTNEGARVDTLSLSASSDQGWTTQLSPAAVTLDPGASSQIVLQVQVPADAVPETVDVTTLTATSAYGAAARVSNVDTTTAIQAGYQLFLPLVHRDYSVP